MKKYLEKRLLKMFLTEDEVLMGYKDTDQNISARSLTFLIFAVGWALCGQPQREHENDATAVTFCIKMFKPIKPLIFCQETSPESGLLHTFYLFTII